MCTCLHLVRVRFTSVYRQGSQEPRGRADTPVTGGVSWTRRRSWPPPWPPRGRSTPTERCDSLGSAPTRSMRRPREAGRTREPTYRTSSGRSAGGVRRFGARHGWQVPSHSWAEPLLQVCDELVDGHPVLLHGVPFPDRNLA